ncbi:hypothetical protein BC834DRAFT_466125 [Gloeopeniophorella convolvens]|nr:hypothetical protein BC834DRAFT_466125 [Gloeopeniophorella convolvens]
MMTSRHSSMAPPVLTLAAIFFSFIRSDTVYRASQIARRFCDPKFPHDGLPPFLTQYPPAVLVCLIYIYSLSFRCIAYPLTVATLIHLSCRWPCGRWGTYGMGTPGVLPWNRWWVTQEACPFAGRPWKVPRQERRRVTTRFCILEDVDDSLPAHTESAHGLPHASLVDLL